MKVGPGCVVHVALAAALAVVVDQLTSPQLPPQLRFVVAVPAGLLIALGLSSLWTLAQGYGQGDASRAAVLERARTGQPPPRDGPIVATGLVRTEGATLHGPISGVACVAYQYRLYTSQWLPGSRHREVPIYWGYAARPFRIDSPATTFQVLAVPQLADPPTQHTSMEARARASAYVAATHYEPKRALAGIASAAAVTFRELLKEPSGDVRRDWQAQDVNVDFDALLMEEIVVPVGAAVSVSGRWSGERRAIVPGELGEGELGVTLVTGAAEELGRGGSSELPSSVLSVAVTAALLLLAGAALVWLSTTGRIAQWWRAW